MGFFYTLAQTDCYLLAGFASGNTLVHSFSFSMIYVLKATYIIFHF